MCLAVPLCEVEEFVAVVCYFAFSSDGDFGCNYLVVGDYRVVLSEYAGLDVFMAETSCVKAVCGEKSTSALVQNVAINSRQANHTKPRFPELITK